MPHNESEAECIGFKACDLCGSSDNVARYADGGEHCFTIDCTHHVFPSTTTARGDTSPVPSQSTGKKTLGLCPPSDMEVLPLIPRGIDEITCKKWGYKIGTYKGQRVHVANFYNESGTVVAQKLRFRDKSFLIVGDIKKALPLYGQWLWRSGGKKVIITEGEIDALTVSQLQNNKWPVVSIQNGSSGASKCCAKAMDWLSLFEEVVFLFDNDEPGRAAAVQCAALFPAGVAKIATLPLKDANEMLLAGQGAEVIDAVWSARVYTPEAVASVMDLIDEATAMPERGIDWPWPTLTDLTYGIHSKKAYYLGAGVGVGKTNWAKELQSYLVNVHQLPVGVFMLEEALGRTLKGIAGKFAGIPFHKPDAVFTQEQLRTAIENLDGKVSLFRHDKVGTDWVTIKSAIIYMVEGQGIKHIFLDNLTVMVAHLDPAEGNAEINKIAKEIAHLTHKHDFTIFGFSHLNPPAAGADHEHGGKVHERQFTGSRGLMRFGQYILGIERNKDPELPIAERNRSQLVLLKDRDYGNVGRFPIDYNPDTDQYLEPKEDLYGFDGGDDY